MHDVHGPLPDTTILFVFLIVLATIFFQIRYNARDLNYGPIILTMLGILGCFIGIALGLFHFDTHTAFRSTPVTTRSPSGGGTAPRRAGAATGRACGRPHLRAGGGRRCRHLGGDNRRMLIVALDEIPLMTHGCRVILTALQGGPSRRL
jgi:hypothetical protein